MESRQEFLQEFSSNYGIPQKLVIEMDSSILTLWGIAHSLNKIVLLQILIEHGFSRDEIYKRCNDDLQELKQMFVESCFVLEMSKRGIDETKKGNDAIWGMIEIW